MCRLILIFKAPVSGPSGKYFPLSFSSHIRFLAGILCLFLSRLIYTSIHWVVYKVYIVFFALYKLAGPRFCAVSFNLMKSYTQFLCLKFIWWKALFTEDDLLREQCFFCFQSFTQIFLKWQNRSHQKKCLRFGRVSVSLSGCFLQQAMCKHSLTTRFHLLVPGCLRPKHWPGSIRKSLPSTCCWQTDKAL